MQGDAKTKSQLIQELNELQRQADDYENWFAPLVENMGSGVAILGVEENDGANFYFKFVNLAAERLFGLPKAEINGKLILNIFPAWIDSEFFKALQRVWKSGKPGQLPAVCEMKLNQHFWCEYWLFKLPKGEIVVIFEDITERIGALFELFDKERFLRNIAENYPDAYVALLDQNYKIHFISGQELKKQPQPPDQFHGWTLEQMLGTDAEKINPFYQKTFQGIETRFEISCESQFLLYHTVPMFNGQETVKNILVVIENITQRREIEAALRESEKRYRLLLESMQDSVYVLDRDWCLTLVNAAGEQFTGIPQKKLLGNRLPDLFPGIENSLFFQKFKQVMETRVPEVVVDEYSFADGRKGWYEVRVYPVPEGILCISHDITARKLAEEKLQQTNFLLRAYFQYSPAPVSIFDHEGRYLQVNPTIVEIIGRPESEIIGRTFNELLPSELAKIYIERVTQLQKDRAPVVVEDLLMVNGKNRTFQSILFPIPENSGFPRTFGSIAADITEQKQAENQLKRNKALLEVLINSPQETVSLLDLEGTVLKVNISGAKRFGKTPEEIIGKNIRELLPPALWSVRKAKIDEVIRTGIPAHFEDQRQNVYFKNSVFPVRDPDTGEILGISIFAEEITERKLADNKLRQSEQLLNDTQKLTKIGGWEYDLSKQTLYWTDETYRIHGVDPKKIKPGVIEHVALSLECYSPEDRPVVLAAFNACVERGIPYDLEFPFTTVQGKKKWIRTTATADLERGKVIRIIGNIMDITELKQAQAENEQLETQLRRSQRMESIGTLAGGIAHDFNNLLTPILGYADLALMELPENSALTEDMKAIILAANRAKELVKQILTFSRQVEQERRPLELQEIVQEAIKLLRPSIPATIEIYQRIDAKCEKVLADPSRMHQVIVNLCTNSFHAMEAEGGVLTIELKQVQVDEAMAQIYPHLEAKEYVRLTISDTGIGMDDATLDRVFDPFFSTKPVNKGTGLGLSVVHGIVRSHDGDIVVFSEPGKGTTAHVFLPIASGHFSGASTQTAKPVHRGQEKILLVDDEVAVGKMLKKMLGRIGYQVKFYHRSLEALKVFKAHPENFDLVITDLTMPQLNGVELAKQFHKIRPECPVILSTGYGENISGEILVESGICEIVGKPFDLVRLSAVIRKFVL